jgi:hypothetical protein
MVRPLLGLDYLVQAIHSVLATMSLAWHDNRVRPGTLRTSGPLMQEITRRLRNKFFMSLGCPEAWDGPKFRHVDDRTRIRGHPL